MRDRTTSNLNSSPSGFTLIEMLIVLILASVVITISIPSVSRWLRASQTDRAAEVVAMDLEMAISLAARQRQPVRISHQSGSLKYEIRTVQGNRLLHERELGLDSQYGVEIVTFTPSTVDIMPAGIASGPLLVKVVSADKLRTIRMSRAGHVLTGGTVSMKNFGTSSRGFTIIEIMIAMTLLSVVLIPLAGLTFDVAQRSLNSSSDLHRTAVAAAQVGRLGVLPFDSLATKAGCATQSAQPLPQPPRYVHRPSADRT